LSLVPDDSAKSFSQPVNGCRSALWGLDFAEKQSIIILVLDKKVIS
jgi:hypothetical protein